MIKKKDQKPQKPKPPTKSKDQLKYEKIASAAIKAGFQSFIILGTKVEGDFTRVLEVRSGNPFATKGVIHAWMDRNTLT